MIYLTARIGDLQNTVVCSEPSEIGNAARILQEWAGAVQYYSGVQWTPEQIKQMSDGSAHP